MTDKFEYKSYPCGALYFEEGWYSMEDLKKIVETYKHVDEIQQKQIMLTLSYKLMMVLH